MEDRQRSTRYRKGLVWSDPRERKAKDFRFFALAYLNDWWLYDRRFVAGLCRCQSREVRLHWLAEAADYYDVSRRFPKSKDVKNERLGKALDVLDAGLNGVVVTRDNVDSTVCKLAEEFASTCGRGKEISAASKFLWIRCKAPVVVLDERAKTCLRRLDGKIGEDYAQYRKKWLNQFEQREEAIRLACAELPRVKDFSPDDETGENLKSTVTSRWFHERVFDKFLWWNGGTEGVVD